ncbi:MAG: TetR/AcrR family transcriptional regulator C-terminal domain-containing protein [Oscillospiraceae bacterium]|nr:TetR/AcrR family transcriptional regulator C-terminal domain-containing protein [Oscillospiraceae bacterium]
MEQKSRNVSPFSNEARNAYVIEHITDALLKLLKEKSLQEISISEIVDAAGVGRTSFYRNYETKEDVVKKHIVDLIEKWDRDYKASGKDSNAELYGSLFKHLKDNADFYLLLKERNLMHLFLEVFLEKFGPKPEYANMWAYTTAFITYGTYGWIEEWINRGMQEAAETMAALFSSHGMK